MVQLIACQLFDDKTLTEPMLTFCVTYSEFCEKNAKNKLPNRIRPKIYSDTKYDLGDILTMFCSDWISASYLIVQTRYFFLIM